MADQVTNLTALTWSALVIALVWVFLCIAGAAGVVLFTRFRIMFSCGYGWKDAGVLLRRRSKKALHARLDADRVPRLPDGYVPPSAALQARRDVLDGEDGPGYTEVAEAIAGGTELMETVVVPVCGEETITMAGLEKVTIEVSGDG